MTIKDTSVLLGALMGIHGESFTSMHLLQTFILLKLVGFLREGFGGFLHFSRFFL